ncbi:MAG: hypothetical protein ACI4AB_00515 [Acetatifactor sp.]
MEQDLEYRQQLLQEYKQTVMPLLRYLPWLEKNRGQTGSTLYQGPDSTEHSLAFPVYDSTLMNFVREASKSKLMERNYRYIYTRSRINTHEDERKMIASAELKDWDNLRGILSKYVLGGMTKGVLWSEAVQENIFYLVLMKMKEIIEYWDKPLDIR